MSNNQASALLDIFSEYERDGVVSQAEIESILNALSLLKRESGWGRIELVIKGSELNDVNVTIWHKMKPDEGNTNK